jgi:predicted transcriptional regulator
MTISDIRTLLSCDVYAGDDLLDRQVLYGCASDLMSDVLAFSRSGAVLLTGLVNVQTIQTAYIADVDAVIVVRGKRPDQTIISFAKEKHVPLLGTPYSMYEASGILYRAGIPSTMQAALKVDNSGRA